jgi:hypothetical protein
MSVEQVIIAAIRDKISLEVNYKNHSRLISPIRLGWKTTEEEGLHKNVFCYQFDGYSSSGLRPNVSPENYRCWNLSDIYSAVPVRAPWYGSEGWPRERSSCIDDVIAGPPA